MAISAIRPDIKAGPTLRKENPFKTVITNDKEKEYLDELILEDTPELNLETFISFYNEDKMGGMIRNLETWLKDNFQHFKGYIDDAE